MPMRGRELKTDLMLANNIRALLTGRGLDDSALAMWCGHKPGWISKILSGDRGIQVRELGKVADFFGLTVSQLFQYGIDPLMERRHGPRRKADRRVEVDRRQPKPDHGVLHPSKEAAYRRKYKLPK